jgi:hypothetical protein
LSDKKATRRVEGTADVLKELKLFHSVTIAKHESSAHESYALPTNSTEIPTKLANQDR